MRRDQDDRQLWLLFEGLFEKSHAVDLGHLVIGDDQVDVVLSKQSQPLLAVFGGQHVVSIASQLGGQNLPQVRLVVDDQDLLSLRNHALKLRQRGTRIERNRRCGLSARRTATARLAWPGLIRVRRRRRTQRSGIPSDGALY